MPNTFDVVLKFEQLINSRSAEAVCSLLMPDTVLIDSLGNRIQGAEKLRFAWTSYFNTVPDYSISHSEIFADGNMVAVFGTAQGTFSRDGQLAKENVWSTDYCETNLTDS